MLPLCVCMFVLPVLGGVLFRGFRGVGAQCGALAHQQYISKDVQDGLVSCVSFSTPCVCSSVCCCLVGFWVLLQGTSHHVVQCMGRNLPGVLYRMLLLVSSRGHSVQYVFA